MFYFLIIFILLNCLNKCFKIMKIVIPQTSGLNVVDKKFEPKYFVKNKLRFVSPYVYTYKLFSKKRWVGKKIADVMTSEFCAYDMNYFIESIKKGYVKVNEQMVSSDYIIQNNDFIEHKLLLFEKPVLCNKIIILYEDDNFICVYKHSSLPTHPVGSYQYNSLLRILQNYISTCQQDKHEEDHQDIQQNENKENVNENINEYKNKNNKHPNVEIQSEHVIKINFNFKQQNFGFMPDDIKEKLSHDDNKIKINHSKNYNHNDNHSDNQFIHIDDKSQTYYNHNDTQNINDQLRKDDILNISQERKKRRKIKQENIINKEHINNISMISKENENELDTLNILIKCRQKGINKNNDNKKCGDNIVYDDDKKCDDNIVHDDDKKCSDNIAYDDDKKCGDNIVYDDDKKCSDNILYNDDLINKCKEISIEDTNNIENAECLEKNNCYNKNLKKDLKTQDKSYIYTLHRLDKLTSGIVLFGKNKKFSTFFSQNISDNKIKKTYITRVEGDFRILIDKLLHRNNIMKCLNNEENKLENIIDKYCNSMKYDYTLKFNKCEDHNSFQNDIFLYENNYELNNEENETCEQIQKKKKKKINDEQKYMFNKLIQQVKNNKNELDNYFDMNKFDMTYDHNEDNHNDDNNLNIYHKYFIIDFGYIYCENKKLLKYVFTKYTKQNCFQFSNYLLKPSITKFMFLSYNSSINESLILCQPITGRTHQIRAHLQSLSYPISNDSHYNKMFEQEYIQKSNYLYFDERTRNEHIQINQQINNNNKNDIQPNNNNNNINNNNNNINNNHKQIFQDVHTQKKNESHINKKNSEKYNYFPLIPFINTSFNWLYDKNINLNEQYNEKDMNNYFFKNINNVSYHSSGIFLHSFRYTWKNIFDVFTLLPKWCQSFYLPRELIAFLLYGDLS
ncbi:pseudouridylate synthase, putative [Plasmodium gaboni]|uniref:Pseudouridylate synthase, putative n=1 Tax=Plasmodium gaboni TaxID=647221 RepID=A0ABY1ULU1_9APIC|nr:pseudouridylate synthase, putative [Plasmodium gaboni]